MNTKITVKTPLETVLDCIKGYKGPNPSGFYTCLCPAHNDSQSSLSVKEKADEHGAGVVLFCFAGCTRAAILSALNLTEEDVHYRPDGYKVKTPRPVPLDLITLAIDKGIHFNDLARLGLREGAVTFPGKDGKPPYTKQGVIIPYYDEAGNEYQRARLRTAVKAKEGSVWTPGEAPLIPYGLQRIEKARDARELTIVEGESDCWTLWAHGFPALGVPGARLTSVLKAEYFHGIEKVFIMQEPDKAGETFTAEIKKRLTGLGYAGRCYALDLSQWNAKDPNELHKHDIRAFSEAFKTALLRARPLFKQVKPKIHLLRDLQQEQLPETRWAIPDILPEGLTLLVGKPKLGKSWLALSMQTAIASGGVALGNVPVEQGKVLYISLEDNKKRLQKRSNIVLRNGLASSNFAYATEWPRLNEGGIEQIEDWITEHPDTRLICIDTWARFKPKAQGRNAQQYDEDYDALTPLQRLASERGIAIVLIHHFRKMEGEDPIDMISGSTAMAGAVDNFLLLYRKRGEDDARLWVGGRDIEDEQEYLLSFEKECATWTLKGDADSSEVAGTPQQQEIINALMLAPNGLPVKALAEQLGKNVNTTRNLLAKLRNDNKVTLRNNVYSVVTHSKDSNRSQRSNHSKLDAQEDESGLEVTTLSPEVTTPYYGVTTVDENRSNLVNPLAKPSQNGNSAKVTTLTTVTTDVSQIPPFITCPTHGQTYMHQVKDVAMGGVLVWKCGRC